MNMLGKSGNTSVNEMALPELARYIMDIQHAYLKKTWSTFSLCAKAVIEANKAQPGNRIMNDVLDQLSILTHKHFEEEEQVLFPYIRLVINDPVFRGTGESTPFAKMKADHTLITRLFKKLRLLSNNYTPLPGADPGVKLCYAQLFNFEQDMIRHIFLEEDLLVPRLIKKHQYRDSGKE